MVDRIAVGRVINGVGSNRKVYMPGDTVVLTAAQAAALDAHETPVVRDPGSPRPEIQVDEARAAARVAEPAAADPGTAVHEDGNISREEPSKSPIDDEL